MHGAKRTLVTFLTIYDTSHLSYSTYKQQKHLPTLQKDVSFIAIFSTYFPRINGMTVCLSGNELICFLFEVDPLVLFKAGCEGHSLHD